METTSLNFSLALSSAYQRLNHVYLVAIFLVILSGSYLALAGSTVGLTTVQWDEFTDLVIASELSQHPLSGHSYDGSQARFPMYVTAVAYRVMQMFNPDIGLLQLLPASRWISILMIVVAIWGTFILGYRLFNAAVGILAAALLTFSPYILHFGRAALTQGDAFTTATVVFTLITFQQFTSKRTTIWLVCFSFCLALAIAAKFLLAVLVPAFLTYHLLLEISNRYRKPDPLAAPDIIDETTTIDWPYTFLAVGTGFLAMVALTISLQRFEQPLATSQLMNQVARLIWGVTLLGIFLCFLAALKNFKARRSNHVRSSIYWRLDGAWLATLPLTFATMLALFPTHIFSPYVLPTLIERFVTMDGNSDILATSLDSAKLYLGLLLFKLGLPFGVATCIALAWAVRKSIHSKAFLLITLVLFFYGLLLAVLPLQQPFWLMSVYPLIMLALSAMIVQGLTNLKNTKLRLIWAGYVAIAIGWLMVGLVHVYPTFGYYGYELIGDRWLGNNSRGYSGVVVVTNDGSTEAIDWLRQNVSAGSVVISYLDDPHIINYLASTQPFAFDFKHALQYQDKKALDKELAHADFVVARAIDDGLSAPVTDPAFIQHFGPEPVFQIFRGRGWYRMPVVQIYQRLPDVTVLK